MIIRSRSIIALAAVATLAFGMVACTENEQDAAQADANEAAAETEVAVERAADALGEEAAQVGSAISAGAKEVAQEVDEATDNLARDADEQEAETAADARGN